MGATLKLLLERAGDGPAVDSPTTVRSIPTRPSSFCCGRRLRRHGQTSLAVAPAVLLKVRGVARANLFARGFPQQEPSRNLAVEPKRLMWKLPSRRGTVGTSQRFLAAQEAAVPRLMEKIVTSEKKDRTFGGACDVVLREGPIFAAPLAWCWTAGIIAAQVAATRRLVEKMKILERALNEIGGMQRCTDRGRDLPGLGPWAGELSLHCTGAHPEWPPKGHPPHGAPPERGPQLLFDKTVWFPMVSASWPMGRLRPDADTPPALSPSSPRPRRLCGELLFPGLFAAALAAGGVGAA